MSWIKVTPENGRAVYVNTDNVAYIAEPPTERVEDGAGAGISFIDDTTGVLAVKESTSDLLRMMLWEEL